MNGITVSIIMAIALTLSLAVLESGVGLSHGEAIAGTHAATRVASATTSTKARRARRSKQRKKQKICTTKNGKRRCRWMAKFQGQSVPKRSLRTDPLPKPSGEIWLYAVNFREELKVNIYGEDGEFDDEALAQLDEMFRCKRTGQQRAVSPQLYEVLSIIYDHFGKRRIDLISGFRKKPDNETSRHFHGSAMDIRVPGVSIRKLYKFASGLDMGNMGVGHYPLSKFVHVDFRSPGEKSYRWTDYSAPTDGSAKKRKSKKRPPRKSRRDRPNS